MFSIVDLINAGTVTRELAAYSLAAISKGASFIVGAMPGGAGKTTVMGVLLNFVPADVQLTPAVDLSAIKRGLANKTSRSCFICHEIGRGSYYAYLWGNALRMYFDLPDAGHMLATNLHADGYKQAQRQICGQNDVSLPAFRRMNLMFFLTVNKNGRSISRHITEVWESNGESEHLQIFGPDNSSSLTESSRLVSASDFARARQDINQIMESGKHTIEDVRSMLLKR